MGDERPRYGARERALPLDARGRRSATADGGRADQWCARARSRAVWSARSPAHRALSPGQGKGGLVLVKVCVVGCGAVGSLFAANLAQLEDVEVWAYDQASEHVDAINERGLRLTGAGDVVG